MSTAQFIRKNARRLYDEWKAALAADVADPGTWSDYLADAVEADNQQRIIYIVTVSSVPVCAFTEEHKAEHYVDHHRVPNLSALNEVVLD